MITTINNRLHRAKDFIKSKLGFYNLHIYQKKWIDVAIKKSKNSSLSWGKSVEEEEILGNYLKLRDELLIPNIKDKIVLELGCLDGKWSQYIIPYAKHSYLVDLSKEILPVLQTRLLKKGGEYTFYETKGFELDGIADNSIDLIFSMDTLVRVKNRT